MKIAVMGAGGVGGYFGARLAAAGHDVSFIARGVHLDALRAHGISILSELGNLELHHVNATDQPNDVGVVDVAILAVKLWDTESSAKAMSPMLGSHTMVLSLQNGVQKDEILRSIAGERAVIGGVCYIAASIARPGTILHSGSMQRIEMGEFDGKQSERVMAFLKACQNAGIDAQISDDITKATWEKYVFLVGLSACTGVVRQPIGIVRANASSRALLLDTMREVVDIARARGVALDPAYAENRLTFIDGLPEDMRASMAVDLERGNRLELPWLSGGVVTLGEQCGVATLVNRVIAAALAPYVDGTPKAHIGG